MALQKHLLTPSTDGTAKRRVDCAACAQVKEVDAVIDGLSDDGFDLIGGGMLNAAHAEAENAELFMRLSAGELPVFHKDASLS